MSSDSESSSCSDHSSDPDFQPEGKGLGGKETGDVVAPHKSFQLRKFPPQVAAQHPYLRNIFLVIQSNRGFSCQHISRTPSRCFQRQRSGNSICARPYGRPTDRCEAAAGIQCPCNTHSTPSLLYLGTICATASTPHTPPGESSMAAQAQGCTVMQVMRTRVTP